MTGARRPRLAGLVLGALLAGPVAAPAEPLEPALCAPAAAPGLPGTCTEEAGTLVLSIVDASSGLATPARLEVIDASGQSWLSDDALVVGGDCSGHPVPAASGASVATHTAGRGVRHPQQETFQFYLDGGTAIALPPGRYRVSAHKGLEYRPASREIEVAAGRTTPLTLGIERWIDMPALGWFSADDHLHIVRSGPEHDSVLARWMQAEDLNVANLLQMEIYPGVDAAKQYGFGPRSVHQDGDTIVASGQENPRTWILGHGIILGAASYLDFPSDPLSYQRFWDAAARDRALRGYAHWGTGAAREGLAIDAPERRIEFLEVLQSDLLNHHVLYEVLNLGIRMTPTAGTDYPCSLTNLPGRDRFYTRIDGPLGYASWLEGIRRGRTFVTNGPLLVEFTVDGAAIGDRLELSRPGSVTVRGAVRFDATRDDVRKLELVRNGAVVHAASEPSAPGEIRFETAVAVDESTWFALRVAGSKLDLPELARPRAASAHSAPIFVAVAGGTGTGGTAEARRLAAESLRRLTRLEKRLESYARLGPPEWSGAEQADVVRALPGLRAAIASARSRYQDVLGERDDWRGW